MLSKSTKISFTAQAVKHRPYKKDVSKAGKEYELSEAIIFTDMMVKGYGYTAVEITVESENDMSMIATDALIGKTFKDIQTKESISKDGVLSFKVLAVDIKL